jgi:hypothetical protein
MAGTVDELIIIPLNLNPVCLEQKIVGTHLGVSRKDGYFPPRGPAPGHPVGLEGKGIGPGSPGGEQGENKNNTQRITL